MLNFSFFYRPQALNILVELQQQENISMLRKLRLLLALKFSVKAISTKVLVLSRSRFQNIAPEILSYVATVWNSTNQQILAFMKTITPETSIPNELGAILEACKLSIQTIKSLLKYGIPKLSENQTAKDILVALLPSLKNYIEYGKYKILRKKIHYKKNSLHFFLFFSEKWKFTS